MLRALDLVFGGLGFEFMVAGAAREGRLAGSQLACVLLVLTLGSSLVFDN